MRTVYKKQEEYGCKKVFAAYILGYHVVEPLTRSFIIQTYHQNHFPE